jgi:hypothetical protein
MHFCEFFTAALRGEGDFSPGEQQQISAVAR